MELPPRFNVLGVGVHALNLAAARNLLIVSARSGQRGYACFCDVNSISCARRDQQHRARLNQALLTTPDGMPLVWLGRLAGHGNTDRVYGPELLLALCAETAGTEFTHFFHGAGPGTADLLAQNLQTRFPGLKIAGTHTPPFRELTAAEVSDLASRLNTLKPDFIWVGLSTPKQEKFMSELLPRLNHGLMLGVGAAFDFLSGRVCQAPRWIQRSGFEWVWRLCHEPGRLAPRYFKNNPLFVLRTCSQLLRLKKYPLE